MQVELISMKDNDIGDHVGLPDNFKPVGYKWIYKTRKGS